MAGQVGFPLSRRCTLNSEPSIDSQVIDVMNVHLNPHSEQLVREQLEHGEYGSPEEVIERALEKLSGEYIQTRPDVAGFESALDALAQGSELLPVLPDDATTRAGIYQQYD